MLKLGRDEGKSKECESLGQPSSDGAKWLISARRPRLDQGIGAQSGLSSDQWRPPIGPPHARTQWLVLLIGPARRDLHLVELLQIVLCHAVRVPPTSWQTTPCASLTQGRKAILQHEKKVCLTLALSGVCHLRQKRLALRPQHCQSSSFAASGGTVTTAVAFISPPR